MLRNISLEFGLCCMQKDDHLSKQRSPTDCLTLLLGLIRYAMPWSPLRLSITLNAPLAPPIPCYALLTKVQIRYLMCGQNMPWESLTSTSSGLSTTQTILRPDHKCFWPPPSQVSSLTLLLFQPVPIYLTFPPPTTLEAAID